MNEQNIRQAIDQVVRESKLESRDDVDKFMKQMERAIMEALSSRERNRWKTPPPIMQEID